MQTRLDCYYKGGFSYSIIRVLIGFPANVDCCVREYKLCKRNLEIVIFVLATLRMCAFHNSGCLGFLVCFFWGLFVLNELIINYAW